MRLTAQDPVKIQQAAKWTVYALLIINFVFYVIEDWNRAAHTLHAGSSFLDWTSEFANSIDESAWFVLLFMFELETYVVSRQNWKGWLSRTVRVARLLCYALIAHTVYAYLMYVVALQPTVAVEDATNLCDLTGADVSFVSNLQYTQVDEQSCGELSGAAAFYWVEQGSVVSDSAGLTLERNLAWADLVEALVWLTILLAIEIVVRRQAQGATGGVLVPTVSAFKVLLYLSLIAIGVYWASLSHWLYLWDELVWIGGFAAIEMNISHRSDAGRFARRLIVVALVSTGLILAVFGNLWVPTVFGWLSGSEIGAWLELIVPFLPMVLIGAGAALFTFQETSRHSRSRIR